jgi:hypothetical protein
MKKITSVRTSVKEDKVLAVIFLENVEKPVFLTSKQVHAATGLNNNFSILKGSSLDVVYYKKGDKLVNGGECSDDNTLVKEYAFELSDTTAKIATAAAFGASMF